MPLFESRNTEQVTALIERLLDSAKAPAAVRTSVVGASLGWGMTFQDMLDFRAIEVFSGGKSPMSITAQVISRLAGKKNANAKEFSKIYERMVANWEKNSPKLPNWRFIVPFHVRFESKVKLPYRFSSIGQRVSLTTWDRLCHRYGRARLSIGLRQLFARKDKIVPHHCLVFNGRGADCFGAWWHIESSFSTARGMFEFLVSRRRFLRSSEPKPQHLIPHPPWSLAVQAATYETDGFYFAVENVDLDPGKPLEVTPNLMILGKQYLREVIGNPISNSTCEIIGSAFRLYAQAMDVRHHHQAFLGFWQVLESIALATDQLSSGEQVCKRLVKVLATRCTAELKALPDLLRDLRKRRNELVHRGTHESIVDDDVHFAKLFAEMGIEWLTDVRKELPTRLHLEKYFQHSTASNADLLAARKAIRKVDRERQRSRK